MNRIIMIGSMTNAQKAKRALMAKGIRVRLTKNDTPHHGIGCVYGIELTEGDLLGAISTLHDLEIEYRVL